MPTRITALLLTTLLLTGCGQPEPTAPERYAASDALMASALQRLDASEDLDKIVEIDHSRLGWEAGSVMPPARVVMFSNAAFDAALLQKNPLVGIDLPFRVLAFEQTPGGESAFIHNSFAFLQSRYGLDTLPGLREQHDRLVSEVVGEDPVANFPTDQMQPDGIVTLPSPFDFETTLDRVQVAIDAQDDTVNFGRVDFQQRARDEGLLIRPSTLVLFGGPGPGAKAMSEAPTLGLDAFCQKFLVWEDETGQVHLSFNDLLALAERQGVGPSLPLRVINRRLESVFTEALSE